MDKDNYGVSQNGLPREAVVIFNSKTSEHVKPNHIMFVCVLYACCVGGFGWEYFFLMIAVDREKFSTYVMLSDISAESSKWDNVVDSRELIESTEIKEMSGSCWI